MIVIVNARSDLSVRRALVRVTLRKRSETSKVISLNDQFVVAVNAGTALVLGCDHVRGPSGLEMVLDNDEGPTIFDLNPLNRADFM